MSAPDYSQITDQRLRVAVARQLGWTLIEDGDAPYGWARGCAGRDAPAGLVPNYSESLDAIHEVEATLTRDQCYTFQSGLADQLGAWEPAKCAPNWLWHATARQRCLAYLSVVAPGKLKEI